MACREVSTWITENVLIPVERVITQAREACERFNVWVEEKVRQPLERWISSEERRCREEACNWLCLCCNKWFCWIVFVVIRVITWILITVVKWVVHLICKIVTTIIGIVVELVLKVLTRIVTFFVCLFTGDLLGALATIWDLFNDVIDAVDDLLEFVVSLLDDASEIIREIGDLLGSLGRTFCIYGDGACSFFSALFGVFKGLLDWAADVVDWVRDTVEGIRDLVLGILSLNWCRIQKGLGIFNILRGITSGTRLPGMALYVGPVQLDEKRFLEATIETALSQALANQPGRLNRSRERASLGGAPIGVPMLLDPRRIAVRSSEFLRDLHNSGALNLYALAGRFTDCQGKATWDQFDGEIVYTGTRTTVTKKDIDYFLELGPEAVPSFTVYPITREALRGRLELAKRKGLQLGLKFTWPPITEIVVGEARFVPLNSDESNDLVQKDLLRLMGRPDEGEDLSVIPVVAVFGYVLSSLNGLTSVFRPADEAFSPSGTTFRDRFPKVIYQYVAIHEIGHYVGLDHKGHTSPSQIMWKPSQGIDWGDAVLNYLFTTGEANFSLDDITTTWQWITTTPQALDSIFP
jgi:hypothetical protein